MTEKTIFKDSDSPEFKAGIEEGIRRIHNLIQYTIANSDNDLYNEIRREISEDILEYSEEHSAKWKEIQQLRMEYAVIYHADKDAITKEARAALLKQLRETTVLNDLILEVAKNCGLQQISSCCNVPMKTCANDTWKGDIAGFARQVFKEALPKE